MSTKVSKLVVQNFQSVAGPVTLSFSPGLNVIVGPNNVGKSSLMRALRLVYRDAFRGTFYIKRGETLCRVAIITDTNIRVLRHLERVLDEEGTTNRLKENVYTVTRKGEDPVTFSKFGGRVPGEVTGALEITDPISIGDTVIDLNIADQQRDPIFLFDRPGSVSARLLSYIVGLEPVHQAMRDISKQQRQVKSNQDIYEQQLVEVSDAVRQFPAQELETTFKKLDATVQAVRDLEGSIDDLRDIETDLKSVYQRGREAAARRDEINEILQLPWDEAVAAVERTTDLQDLFEEYLRVNRALEERERQSSGLQVQVEQITEFISDWESLLPDLIKGQQNTEEMNRVSPKLQPLEAEIEQLEKEYHDYLHELGVCPTCNQQVVA